MQSSPQYWATLERLCKIIEIRLNKAFLEALEQFNKHYGEVMYLYCKRDMANTMHIHIRDRIRANFAELPWAHVIDKANRAFMLLIVGESLGIPVIVGIKFKKQTKGLKTANVQTQAVIDFNSQQIEYLKYVPEIQKALPLPGMADKVTNPPMGCNLIASYMPDFTWAKYARLTMIFPLGGSKVRLLTDFTHVEIGKADNVTPMPSQEKPKQTKRVHRRRNTTRPTRTKLRKFISPYVEAQETNDQDLKKKKGNNGQSG